MKSEVPRIQLMASIFMIPSMIDTSRILGYELVGKVKEYSDLFTKTLLKHLLSETGIVIENGAIQENSILVLEDLVNEQKILQYRDNLELILGVWHCKILGHPVFPAVFNIVDSCTEQLIEVFTSHVKKVQKYALKIRHEEDNHLIKKIGLSKTRVVNLTDRQIRQGLVDLLNKGRVYNHLQKCIYVF